MTLADLRAHLVACFEPGVRIVGNTTAGEICDAIDDATSRLAAMTVARDEALEIVVELNEYTRDPRVKMARVLRVCDLRKVGSP